MVGHQIMNTFEVSGRCFDYQVSDYNSTPICERAVEVPVGLFLLARDPRADVLEVGAVLPHYRIGWPDEPHPVIDLHEVYRGVINADVLTWEPPHPYDLIISISTLDHLRDEDEFDEALTRLQSWLAPGGLLYVTLPYGQPAWIGGGAWLDRFLLDQTGADVVWRMDKVNPQQHLWKQVYDGRPPLAYHGRSLFANTVYMLLWGDVDSWWQR